MENKLGFMTVTKFRGPTVPKDTRDPISAFPCIKHCDSWLCFVHVVPTENAHGDVWFQCRQDSSVPQSSPVPRVPQSSCSQDSLVDSLGVLHRCLVHQANYVYRDVGLFHRASYWGESSKPLKRNQVVIKSQQHRALWLPLVAFGGLESPRCIIFWKSIFIGKRNSNLS